MTDLYISIDTGNSGTKIAYYLPQISKKVEYLLMPSALNEISRFRLKNYLESSNCIGSPAPSQQAWLTLATPERDERIITVGALAEEFSAPDRRNEPKYENALFKFLAAIGVIVETYQLSTRKKLKVHLGVLLPWNEYKDRARLLNRLEILSQEYEFRGRKIRLNLERCVCYPEGGGLAMRRMAIKGKDWFRRQRLGILMLGDRNWTGLYFESGQIKKASSPLTGFSYTIDRIIEQAPCLLTPEKLTNAIFEGISEHQENEDDCSRPHWEELEAIKSLATARDPQLRESEVKDIALAIATRAVEWEEKLLGLCKQVFPKALTELNVCGGPLPFFTPVIREYFNCIPLTDESGYTPVDKGKPFTPVLIGAGTMELLRAELQPNFFRMQQSTLPLRFQDPFCLLDYLVNDPSLTEKAV